MIILIHTAEHVTILSSLRLNCDGRLSNEAVSAASLIVQLI